MRGRRRLHVLGCKLVVMAAMAAAGLTAACSTPSTPSTPSTSSTPHQLDEPWPPDPATCVRHRNPDAPPNSGVRLATRGTYTRQTAHTAVLYFCFQRVADNNVAAHLVTYISGCVTRADPSVIDVPGEARQLEAIPFTITICDQGHGSFSVGLRDVDEPPGEIIDEAYVSVTADEHGVLIEEIRNR